MINRITVSEKRGLFPEYGNLGTIGERNATTLLFLLPAALQGYSKNIVCVTSQGSFCYEISSDTFDLPSEVLTDNTLQMQLVLKDGDRVIWKSVPYTFTLNPTLDDSGNHGDGEQEKLRQELAKKLHELTGKDYTNYTWEQLIVEVSNISEITPEIQELIDQATDYEDLLNLTIDKLWAFYKNYYGELSTGDEPSIEIDAET